MMFFFLARNNGILPVRSVSQLGTVDAEIKVPSIDQSSPSKAWSRSEYSHACFAHCQVFLHCPNFDLPGPFTFFFPLFKSSPYFRERERERGWGWGWFRTPMRAIIKNLLMICPYPSTSIIVSQAPSRSVLCYRR